MIDNPESKYNPPSLSYRVLPSCRMFVSVEAISLHHVWLLLGGHVPFGMEPLKAAGNHCSQHSNCQSTSFPIYAASTQTKQN